MATAPRFWFRSPASPGLLARVLQPLGWLYAAGTAGRLRRATPDRVAVPVICVGNVNVGGTGKTPTVIALAQRLVARGVAVHVVSRGYGGRLTGPVRVDETRHLAEETGDEPLLIAAFAPVWVAGDRVAGARAAVAAGAQAILLDDGHQDPSLSRDLSIVVVDAARGFGNGLCLPAGPLREPVGVGLARADMVIALGSGEAQRRFVDDWGQAIAPPLLAGALVPLATGMDWTGLRALAFAGIGDPGRFFETLRRLGAEIVRAEPLDDHQPFTPALLHRLMVEAEALGAQLVTTEKDAVRLPPAFRARVLAVPVRMELDDWGPIDARFASMGL